MGSIGRYIFRATLSAFALILGSLTAIIWVTYALRDIDLMTSQGQTILVFMGMTALAIPQLVLVIAPVAFLIAVAHILNKLASDSEIIVMNAAGMSPWQAFRALFATGLLVALFIGFVGSYLSPECLRQFRRWATEVRLDVITNIVQPGRFLTIDRGLTFHIHERRPNGLLVGVFVDDSRNPTESTSILAEEGQIIEQDGGTFLLLKHGSIQRHRRGERDPTIVNFESYAFDLSGFRQTTHSITYPARERYTWQLLVPDPKDPVYTNQPGQVLAELHDRIAGPLYPLAFVVIAYAYLGAPRTTRQSRGVAIAAMIGVVGFVRLAGFVSLVVSPRAPWALAIQYVALGSAFVLGLAVISRGIVLEAPTWVMTSITGITERLARRFAQ